MGLIRINKFQGTRPAVTPRLRNDFTAETAQNCHIEKGAIIPMTIPSSWVDVGATTKSIYLAGSTWVNFTTKDVKPIPSFLQTDDRYYYADGTQVRQADTAGNDFPLGVPKPASAPTNQIQGTPTDTTIIWSGQYVYCYVTAWGEESAPSEPSGSLDVQTGQYITVSGFSTPPANHNITHIRLYRLVTGTARSEYEQVDDDFLTSVTEYDDHLEEDELIGTILPSTNWDEPPTTMKGIIEYANQILIGFDEDKIYLSEPGYPHAWPYEYEISNPVVGIANAGGACFVLTTGHPVMLTGNDPSMIQQIELPYNQPCQSYAGIVETPSGVIFPSSDGLFMLNASDGQLISKGFYTREQWQDFELSKMAGFLYNDFCYFFFEDSGAGIRFPLADDKNIRTFDIEEGMGFDSCEFVCGYMDGETLYVACDNIYYGTSFVGTWRGVFEAGTENATFTWKSKKFYSDNYSYIGAIQVHGDADVTVKIYADGSLVDTVTATDNTSQPCEAGYLAREFQFELSSDDKIIPPFTAAKTIYELNQQT